MCRITGSSIAATTETVAVLESAQSLTVLICRITDGRVARCRNESPSPLAAAQPTMVLSLGGGSAEC